MEFVRRDKNTRGQGAINIFRCDAYRGLYGPDDDGKCTVTDFRVSRFVFPATKEGQ